MEVAPPPAEIVEALAGITDPWELLRRAGEVVPAGRMKLGTSGQLTGTAIIEGAVRHGLDLKVFTVDTERLFPETVDYFDRLEAHYGISVDRARPDPAERDRMIGRHGTFLFFDSKEKQEYCCEIRKVRPNYRALADADVWVTGLRRDQSRFRAETPRVAVAKIPDLDAPGEAPRELVKIAPLVDWTEAQTREFLAAHGAPIHPLLREADSDWFFESLGCVICTTRQARWEPPRAGRWRWFNTDDAEKKECGIHLPPSVYRDRESDDSGEAKTGT